MLTCHLCPAPPGRRGLCGRCYQRARRRGELHFYQRAVDRRVKDRICQVPGCGRPHVARGYCSTHHQQLRRTGRILPSRQKESS